MADQDTVDLLVCGPFGGIDTRTAGPYADPKTATQLSNADTHRLGSALATAYGRSAFISFNNVAGDLVVMATYTVAQDRILYIAQDTAGNTVYYDSSTKKYGTLANLAPFTEAIQSNGTLWLNNGQQIFYGPDGPQVATWQYPKPTAAKYSYSASADPGVRNPLDPGIYSYAFVQKIEIVNIDSKTFQYTTAAGDVSSGQDNNGNSIFPFSVDNTKGNSAAILQGIFAGFTEDGYAFTTQVFRYSTNSPAWFLLVELTENNQYIDNASDASIAGNQQIIPNQDPPPTGLAGYPPNPIEAHQDALWTMAIVNNKGTSNLPQTQVWYSRPGEPWSFDAILQTLLIEDEETTLQTDTPGVTGVPFGDFPSALCALGSSLLTLRRQTTSLIYGVDEATYQPLKIFADLGCIAPLSVVKANGLVWWLSAQGVYGFDGSNVQWISTAIYNLLQSIPPAYLNAAVGFYADFTYFLTFPGFTNAQNPNGLTLAYYIPSQTWQTRPYYTPSVAFATALPSDLTATPLKMNQIAAVRPNSFAIDFWETGDLDLGLPVSATYTSQETDSGQPQWQKVYQFVLLYAPLQPGVTADVTLIVNSAPVKTWKGIDLSKGPPAHVIPVPNDVSNGCLVQLSVTLHNSATPNGAAILYSAKVAGYFKRAWTVQTNPTGSSR